jgi:hypothetical protein
MEDNAARDCVREKTAGGGGGEGSVEATTPPPRFMHEDEVARFPPVALASYPRSGTKTRTKTKSRTPPPASPLQLCAQFQIFKI